MTDREPITSDLVNSMEGVLQALRNWEEAAKQCSLLNMSEDDTAAIMGMHLDYGWRDNADYSGMTWWCTIFHYADPSFKFGSGAADIPGEAGAARAMCLASLEAIKRKYDPEVESRKALIDEPSDE